MSTARTETEQTAMDEFGAMIRRGRQAAKDAAEKLDAAAPVLLEALRHDTGQSAAVRQIIWSLYTGDHLVPLGYILSGLDLAIAEALSAAITARLMMGADVEPRLKVMLEQAGEFRRYDLAAKNTPEGLPVQYPLPRASADTLRSLAEALDRANA